MFSETKDQLAQRQKDIDHDNAMAEMMDYYDQLNDEWINDYTLENELLDQLESGRREDAIGVVK